MAAACRLRPARPPTGAAGIFRRSHGGCRGGVQFNLRLDQPTHRSDVLSQVVRRPVVSSSRPRVGAPGGILYVHEGFFPASRDGVTRVSKVVRMETFLSSSDQRTPVTWFSKEGQLQVIQDRLLIDGSSGKGVRIAVFVAHR